MSGGPPHHSHGRQAPPSNTAWNRLQVPNYYPRQPQVAHMSNEHPLLHQPTWHTPTTEPMKTIPHSHMFSLDQMLSERSYPRSGVDLTLTRNGSQNGDLPTTPISLSVRDTNKINSLPASALEIQAVELKTPAMKSLSPGLKSTSPGVKPLSPAISTSPGLIERQGSPKNTKKPKRMDSILERLNSQPSQSETNEKSNAELAEKNVEKAIQPIQSVIVQPSNSIHDENSNSSSILNVPTPTNLREEEVTSPYSNDDSLDSNKSRRKRKPSKTIRLTKESDKIPELNEDPLKLDTVARDGPVTTTTNIEVDRMIAADSAKSCDEANEPRRQRMSSQSSDGSPAAKKTRRKTSSESETIAKIAAMVQEVVKESSMESQKVEGSANKSVSVSVIRDTTKEKQASTLPESVSSDNTDRVETNPIATTQELSCSTIITPAQRKATNFVEVENKLEEMFAGIEESSTTPKVDPLEIDCEKIDDFINDSKDEIDSRFDIPSTSQNDVSSTSNDLLSSDKSSSKKTRTTRRKSSKMNSSYEKKKKTKKGKEFSKSKTMKKGKKSLNGKQIKVDAIKDIYAYDSGSNTSSVKSKGPFIQIKGPRDSPISVSIVNTAVEDDTEKKSSKNKKFHDDSEYRHKVRSKGLHCSTLSNKYDAQTKDVSWICVFCKRGPHSTDPNMFGPTFTGQILPPGDLFGPYVITSNCPEYERRLDDPYDKQFKSKKVAGVLDASTGSNAQVKVSGKKSKRKHSESDRSFTELDITDVNLGITETGDKTFEIWVHEDCVVWSPGVYLVGPKIVGLEEAVWTSCNVPCSRCSFRGANICCLRRGCTNVMHFGCAVVSNWQMDFDNYTALCVEHKSM